MKQQFPIFNKHKDLIYLDTAATSQIPQVVIDGMKDFLETSNGSPHRGLHKLSQGATEVYEQSKETLRTFFNVPKSHEIIYVKSTTEGLNLLGQSLANFVKSDHNIVIPITAHHANILPWQRLSHLRDVDLRYVEGDEGASYDLYRWQSQIDDDTAIVALPWVTNALGIDYDVENIVTLAKLKGALSVIDGAQIVAHQQVDLSRLDPDFFVFSGHKMYGPQGIGVLIGRRSLLEKMPPYQVGGDMIEFVTKETATYAPLPQKFEAGTQNVLGAEGLRLAIKFLNAIDMREVYAHEQGLLTDCYERLSRHPKIKVYGPEGMARRTGLIVFNVEGIHPHDVAGLLDDKGIAIRAGHHCCQPLSSYLNTPATCRVSFGLYNTTNHIDRLMEGIDYVLEVFRDE